jgi:hypothetical protein
MAEKPTITITEAQYHEARDQDLGYCLACGAERECCEPDARKYECEVCGEKQVYGVEELLIMGRVTFKETE